MATPPHLQLKVDKYSKLVKTNPGRCESGSFESGGIKWRLAVYLTGRDRQKQYVSIYLALDSSSYVKGDREITVNYKFFVYNKIKRRYSTFPEGHGEVQKFNKDRTERGLEKMISTEALEAKDKGFLVNDEVTFGVAAYVIPVIPRKPKSVVLSLDEKPASATKQWTIDLSKERRSPITPEKFSVGDRRWTVEFYPKGELITDNKHVAFYLTLAGANDKPVYAKFKLRIVNNQKGGKDLKGEAEKWFSKNHLQYGFQHFTEQKTLFTSDFLKDYKVKLEAEILVVYKVKVS